MCICLVTIVLIKAITHHSKLSQAHIFYCSSSRGFYMKGIYFDKACHAHRRQLLTLFSHLSQKRIRHFPKLPRSANQSVWAVLNETKILLLLMFLPPGDVSLFWVLKQIALLLCGKTSLDRVKALLQITLQYLLQVLAFSFQLDSPVRSQATFMRLFLLFYLKC